MLFFSKIIVRFHYRLATRLRLLLSHSTKLQMYLNPTTSARHLRSVQKPFGNSFVAFVPVYHSCSKLLQSLLSCDIRSKVIHDIHHNYSHSHFSTPHIPHTPHLNPTLIVHSLHRGSRIPPTLPSSPSILHKLTSRPTSSELSVNVIFVHVEMQRLEMIAAMEDRAEVVRKAARRGGRGRRWSA
jgi:hypothetical protein